MSNILLCRHIFLYLYPRNSSPIDMNTGIRLKYLPIIVAVGILSTILISCANMSRPSGGPRDTTPPVYVSSNPTPDMLNFTDNVIEIEFDEMIQIDNPSEKIIISPPQLKMPKIQAQGKRVRIELQDSLLPNTTYTIDFSNAIVDNNEKNALEGFSLSFSTGNTRDSLQISGVLLNAADLEPITGMLVGVYSNLDDTAFTTLPMERITASDGRGHFTVRNLKEGSYRVFAIKDGNRNYYFDAGTEDIAFCDSIIVPYSMPKQYVDTLYSDSLTIDSIVVIDYNVFYPNNILLTAFNEQKVSRYMDNKERRERNRMDFIFTTPHDSLPVITPLNFEPKESNWYVLESNPTNDTISYWIRDSLVYNLDTLNIALDYYRTDSLQELSIFHDTLSMTYRAPKEKPKKKRKTNDSIPEVVPTVFAPMNFEISGTQDVHKPVVFSFTTPIDSINRAAFHLYEKQDTLWNELPDSLITITPDSTKARRYLISHKWKPKGAYRIEVDSMAVFDIYGLHTDKQKKDFTIKSMEEYSNLHFSITGVSDSAVVQLLNGSEAVQYEAPVVSGGAEFTYLKPGTYYARLFIDRNGNGKYDTGNYAQKLQPEETYYYPQELELRAYWNVEQDWNIYEKAIDQQKPLAIKKNKPKEDIPEEDDEQMHDPYYDHNDPYGNNPYGNNPYSTGSYGSSGMGGNARTYGY